MLRMYLQHAASRRAHPLLLACLAAVALLLVPARPAGAAVPNSADRVIVWTDCTQLASLSDADLDRWAARGVRGFACSIHRLPGLGGMDLFTPDPAAAPAGPGYALERRLRDGHVGERLRARGMTAYLGFYATNYWH